MKKGKATRTEKLPVTTKKQKFIGFKEFVDVATGEIIPMQIHQVEDRDFNFTKVWLRTFIEGLEGIVNKKMRLAFWIIDNLNSENQFIGTFKKMAEETGLSEYTVIMTMRQLQRGKTSFLKKLQSGVYQINPDILYKGSHKGRMGVVYQFGSIPSKDALEKKKEFDEHEEAKAKAKATDTTVVDTVTPDTAPITGVVTRTIEMSETKDTETETTKSTENATNENVTDTATESVNHRTGRRGTPKPVDWLQIKAKIFNGELSRSQFCKDNHISPNTLKKWLAEND